jgi:hypothetical protein
MKSILTYLKHFVLVSLLIMVVGFAIIVSQHGSLGFGTDNLAFKVGDEGPHIFTEEGASYSLYIKGSREDGFYIERNNITSGQVSLPVYSAFDDSTFYVQPKIDVQSPAVIYQDNEDVFAISDLEGGLKTFKDFLITHKVINKTLDWTFGKGHLVLVGDMVDRGSSVTQLLWFIYKLEQDAEQQGGKVHFIIGNHEIKNLQGNFKSAAHKYIPIAGMLGKQQYELFGPDALLGKWLQSKNAIEKINGHLFVHGGLHPEIPKLGLDIEQVNKVIKENYRQFYFPEVDQNKAKALLTSNKTGPAWYRGYFKDAVSQEQMVDTLNYFDAKAVVVGHTIQSNVEALYDAKLFAIDVKHPRDYADSFPVKHSQALLIKGKQYFRLLDTGEQEEL